MLKRARHIAGLFLLLGSLAKADSPVSPVTWISQELNNLVDTHIDLFVADGQNVLWSIAAVLLVWYLLIGLLARSLRNELIVELILNFMLCSMMLTFYDQPMPWGGGISFHQVWAQEAAWAAGTIDQGAATDLVNAANAMYKAIDLPHMYDVLGVFMYAGLIANLVIIWLFTSGITLIAHIALGFGALVGPLLIPFFVWPALNWIWTGWLRFMTTYALYLIASSAIVYVYAHVMLAFITNFFGGNYSLAQFGALSLPFAVLNGIFLVAFWQCHTWARDLASGSASLGSAVSSSVSLVAMKVLA